MFDYKHWCYCIEQTTIVFCPPAVSAGGSGLTLFDCLWWGLVLLSQRGVLVPDYQLRTNRSVALRCCTIAE